MWNVPLLVPVTVVLRCLPLARVMYAVLRQGTCTTAGSGLRQLIISYGSHGGDQMARYIEMKRAVIMALVVDS